MKYLFFECHWHDLFGLGGLFMSFWLAAANKYDSFFFQTWLQQVDPKLQSQIHVGGSAIFWSM
jgi:hypothetical protein